MDCVTSSLSELCISADVPYRSREERLVKWTRAFASDTPPVVVERKSSYSSLDGEEIFDVTLLVSDERVSTELPSTILPSLNNNNLSFATSVPPGIKATQKKSKRALVL